MICGRNAARGEAVAKRITAAGVPTTYVLADLERVEDCRKVIAEADRHFGRIDILVNAAATTDRGTILGTTAQLFDQIMALNVRAPFLLIQDTARIMRREKTGGSIVNILSMSSHGGQSFLTAYSTSKGALATLTRNVAYALMPDLIRVNGLNIGWMDIPAMPSRPAPMAAPIRVGLPRRKTGSFGRLLKPDEVARAIAFLASAESGLLTGSIIDFDQQVLGASDGPPAAARRLDDA